MLQLDMWRGMGIGLNSQLFLLQGHKQLILGLKDEPGDQVHPFTPHPTMVQASFAVKPASAFIKTGSHK
jgi:hypothetical protein